MLMHARRQILYGGDVLLGLRQHRQRLGRSTDVRIRGAYTPGNSSNPEVSSKDATTDGNGGEDSVTASRSALAVQPFQDQGMARWERHLVKEKRRILPSLFFCGPRSNAFTTLVFATRFSLLIALPYLNDWLMVLCRIRSFVTPGVVPTASSQDRYEWRRE